MKNKDAKNQQIWFINKRTQELFQRINPRANGNKVEIIDVFDERLITVKELESGMLMDVKTSQLTQLVEAK